MDRDHDEEIRDVLGNHLNRDPLERHEIVSEACEAHQNEVDEFLGRTTEGVLFAGCDKRDQRVESSEMDARLRHKDYGVVDDFVVPAIRRMPELFTVLRNMPDPAEAAYTLAKLLQKPQLAERPEYQDFQEILQSVSERRTGKFDNLSIEDFTRALDAYKEHGGDETIDEFFDK